MTEDSAFEKALEFGAQFDLISPICTMVRDFVHGPIAVFIIHRGEYGTARDAFRHKRLFVWGWRFLERPWLCIHCRRDAAWLVAHTLRQAGIVHTTSWRGRPPKHKRRK